MKKDIHPGFYDHAVATCACGASYVVGSTKEKIQVEICSNCHPFYTGTDRVIDTAGRVEKFKSRVRAASPGIAGGRKARTAAKKQSRQSRTIASLSAEKTRGPKNARNAVKTPSRKSSVKRA